jgi:hypothetical protein
VHDEVRGRQPLVDLLDDVHREHVPVRLAGELVGPVARADGDRQSIHPGPLDELDRLVRVRKVDLTGADPVLDATEGAELSLDRYPNLVGHLDNLARDAHVVLEVRWRLAVVHQGAVHHHAREAQVYGALAGLGRVAVVLVQRHGDLGVDLRRRLHEVVEEAVVGVLPRAPGSLDDDRRLGLPGRLHDRLYLLQVVDVERPDAVVALCGLVEKLTHRYQCHPGPSPLTC